ncbi:hypothetical protein B0T17DRAFT_510644 [Bombardia bombarda]|uniref:DUF952 domain-containing protein n=1 Tax=Bombardia bombarda TaxID=252184 RepID=A0AA40BWH5_9PEZI|nr:hypothetical protein B0T17DRAFT_510644 [Bombardia bombarda]
MSANNTTSPLSPLPEYVYKITPDAPPDPIPEAYPFSDLDRQDGFVHLSTAWQCTAPITLIPITADLFFKSTPAFYIIKLRRSNFAPESIKWDEVPGGGCPHLYGNFGAKDVVGVKQFQRGDQSWKEEFIQPEPAGLH